MCKIHANAYEQAKPGILSDFHCSHGAVSRKLAIDVLHNILYRASLCWWTDKSQTTLTRDTFVNHHRRSENPPKTGRPAIQYGQIVEWFADKGYGFIKPDEHGRDNIFLHISQVLQKSLIERGAAVSYRSKFDAVKKSDTASCVEIEPAKDTKTQHRSHFGNLNKRLPYNEFDAPHAYNHASRLAYATGTVISAPMPKSDTKQCFATNLFISTH